MQTRLHKNAKTTLALRKQIKNSNNSISYLAKKFNLNWNTIAKWKNSETLEDKSSRPHNLNVSLTQEQEEKICFERKEFKKSIDDIFCIFENEIPDLYPMKIYRCLKRYNLNILPNEFRDAERKIKKFKKYAIGYIHIDLIYAPKLDKQREYVYTAIDRVSKIAFVMFGKKKIKKLEQNF